MAEQKKISSEEKRMLGIAHKLCTRLMPKAKERIGGWIEQQGLNVVFDGAWCREDRLEISFSGKKIKGKKELSTSDMDEILKFMTGPFNKEIVERAKNNGLEVRVIRQAKSKEQYLWAVEPKRGGKG